MLNTGGECCIPVSALFTRRINMIRYIAEASWTNNIAVRTINEFANLMIISYDME